MKHLLRPLIFQSSKILSKNAGALSLGKRFSSSTTEGKLVSIETNDKTGVSILTLNRPPVNSLNLELLTDIKNAIEEIESNKSRGLILTSSSGTVFSAGLDIFEMYKPNQERLKLFWTTLQDVWLKLYGTGIPTAAAINGHSPAGGCLLATSCEYRAMLPNFTIGLNETQLGIVAPKWFQATLRNVVPVRQAELALTLGRMFKTDEALKVGLIDEVANDKADAIAKCEAFIAQYRKIPAKARAITKQAFRSRDLEELESNREQDVQLFVFTVNQPQVQKGLELYLESLKKK